MNTIINYLIDLFFICYSLYYFIFVLLGLLPTRKETLKSPKSKFAVIIPAHNEEKVIEKLISNLKHIDYPDYLYDIYVIADNCRDKTANIAREQNVNVLERYHVNKKGKGYALKFAFKKLGFLKGNSSYDGAIIFDADNLVKENFLKVMNNRLLQGEKIIQAYIDSKNPADNWVTRAVKSMKNKITDKNIYIKININNEIKKIKLDVNRIHQVLINLIDNAVRCSPKNSTIEISVLPLNNSKTIFSISDQGRGIPQDELENIWQRFYKVDSARTREQKNGSGLGLAIVKEIVSKHGGKVKTESIPGKGSTFSFII